MTADTDSPELRCPHCKASFQLKHTVSLPAEQRMVFAIEHEHPLLSMKTVHGTLAAIEKMLKSTARDIGGDCHVFLEGVDCEPGKTSFRLFVADHDVKKKNASAASKKGVRNG